MEIDRIREIYADLDRYVVTLHPDPITLGPKYLQDNIATIRNHLNAVSKALLDVQAEKHHLSREIRRREDAFKITLDETMASDGRVKKQPNIRDREALANTIHAEEVKTISALKLDLESLSMVEKAIKHRHNELRDTMADVKTQKSLMQSEIDTGSMYGDERIPRSNLTMPSDEMSEEEADDILGSVVAGHHGSAVQTVSFEPPEVEEPAPAKVVKPPVVAPAPPPPPAVVAERPAEPIVAEPVKAGVVPPPAPSEDMADLLEAMGLADKPSAPVPVKEAAPSVAKKEEAKPSLGVEAMSKASAKDDEDIDRFLKGNGKAAMDDDDLMALLT